VDKLSVMLPVQSWNNILAILGDRPFKEVADLVMQIKTQAEAQISTLTTPDVPAEDAEVK
jgi:hypothetical protein